MSARSSSRTVASVPASHGGWRHTKSLATWSRPSTGGRSVSGCSPSVRQARTATKRASRSVSKSSQGYSTERAKGRSLGASWPHTRCTLVSRSETPPRLSSASTVSPHRRRSPFASDPSVAEVSRGMRSIWPVGYASGEPSPNARPPFASCNSDASLFVPCPGFVRSKPRASWARRSTCRTSRGASEARVSARGRRCHRRAGRPP